MSPRRSDDPRTRQRRLQAAQEAARLLAEGLEHDLPSARRKAAARLGLRGEEELPGADEIRAALGERQRLFHGGGDTPDLRPLREAALEAMAFFAAWQPRLAGPVLDGSAIAGTPVTLHLHAEHPDAVARLLQDEGIPAEQRSRELRLDPERRERLPCWTFSAGGVPFELWVLPLSALRQAPLDALEGKPMARATAAALKRLLDPSTR